MYFGEDKKLVESASKIVEEIIDGLPRAEQSEYYKRLRTYQNCAYQKNKLIKESNQIFEGNKSREKEFEKTIKFSIVGVVVFLVANWIFNFASEDRSGAFISLAFAYGGYVMLTERIFQSEYATKIQMYKLEIERQEHEIAKLDVHTSGYSYVDMENYETFSEQIQNKMHFENQCYHTNCCIGILIGMCVIEDISEQARLRMAD